MKAEHIKNGVEAYNYAYRQDLTGPSHGNCYLASLQLISNNTFAPASLYKRYETAYRDQEIYGPTEGKPEKC